MEVIGNCTSRALKPRERMQIKCVGGCLGHGFVLSVLERRIIFAPRGQSNPERFNIYGNQYTKWVILSKRKSIWNKNILHKALLIGSKVKAVARIEEVRQNLRVFWLLSYKHLFIWKLTENAHWSAKNWKLIKKDLKRRWVYVISLLKFLIFSVHADMTLHFY